MNDLILTTGEFDLPQIGSVAIPLSAGRDPIKHLLIGSPRAVRLTIHRLHVLGYANATDWSSLLVLPEHQIIFTPKPGDVMSSLIKYLKLE